LKISLFVWIQIVDVSNFQIILVVVCNVILQVYGFLSTSLFVKCKCFQIFPLLLFRLGIPPADLPKFLRDVADLESRVVDIDDETKGLQPCTQVLNHVDLMFDPEWFVEHGYRQVTLAVQYPGEYILTHPRGAHSVYRLGFSVNEATSIGSPGWVPFGVTSRDCNARYLKWVLLFFFLGPNRSHRFGLCCFSALPLSGLDSVSAPVSCAHSVAVVGSGNIFWVAVN
jgi:hypothetical protein